MFKKFMNKIRKNILKLQNLCIILYIIVKITLKIKYLLTLNRLQNKYVKFNTNWKKVVQRM